MHTDFSDFFAMSQSSMQIAPKLETLSVQSVESVLESQNLKSEI